MLRPSDAEGMTSGLASNSQRIEHQPMALTPKDLKTGVATTRAGLSRQEDDELRRLAQLAKLGDISEEMKTIMVDLLSRDRRSTIREPRDDVRVPVQDES